LGVHRPEARFPFKHGTLLFLWSGILIVLAFIPLYDFDIGPLDKVIHVFCAFITVILFFTAFRRKTGSFLILIGGFVLISSTLVEMLQGFIPGRASNPYDMLANFIGIAAAVFLLARHHGKV